MAQPSSAAVILSLVTGTAIKIKKKIFHVVKFERKIFTGLPSVVAWVAAVVRIQSLAPELLHATGVAKKKRSLLFKDYKKYILFYTFF